MFQDLSRLLNTYYVVLLLGQVSQFFLISNQSVAGEERQITVAIGDEWSEPNRMIYCIPVCNSKYYLNFVLLVFTTDSINSVWLHKTFKTS